MIQEDNFLKRINLQSIIIRKILEEISCPNEKEENYPILLQNTGGLTLMRRKNNRKSILRKNRWYKNDL